MELTVNTGTRAYTVYEERGILQRAKAIIGREGRVFLISEDGVPQQWRDMLQAQYPDAHMHIFPHGEQSKNIMVWQDILTDMLACRISRKDTVIALGGGVTGDMAGFAAACYMRGISYINIPTTTLSQIDSSIGGKTAIDLNGTKNCVGAFWQPDMVLVDPDVLSTLPPRHFYNGLVEAVKEGLVFDPDLFALFEQEGFEDHIEEIICRCLTIKKEVVERDEREASLRKLLNFGHTYGHAYETYFGMTGYYHGECVGMGMYTILNDPSLKERLHRVLERMHCPITCQADPDAIMDILLSDKKADHGTVTVVKVDEIGKGYLQDETAARLRRRLI